MKRRDDDLLWIPENDSQGITVSQDVVEEADAVWLRSLAHIQRHCHDTSQAAAIMEKTAFTVSRLMKRKLIRNLRSFSYRVFKRKYLKQLRKESRFVSLESLSERPGGRLYSAYENELEVNFSCADWTKKSRPCFLCVQPATLGKRLVRLLACLLTMPSRNSATNPERE